MNTAKSINGPDERAVRADNPGAHWSIGGSIFADIPASRDTIHDRTDSQALYGLIDL